MKRLSNKGQFFILAAVIISAIVLSFGFTANQARINREPDNFYDLSYDVKKETGDVIDYEIYTGFEEGTNLTDFINRRAADLKDSNPDANFMFISGNNDELVLRNYGDQYANVGGSSVPGGYIPITSVITYQDIEINVSEDYEQYEDGWIYTEEGLPEGSVIEVEVRGQTFEFPVSKYRQVIFIIQKTNEEGDENYVSVG